MINLFLSLKKSMSLRIIWVLFLIPSCVFSTNELYRRCSQPFKCGDQSGLLYPFWIPGREECGHPEFKLECNRSSAEVSFSSVKFRILEENYISGRIRLARSDFIKNLCPRAPLNVSFVENVLPFAPNTELITIYYGCNFSREVYKFGGMLGCPNDTSLEHKRNYFVTRNLSFPLLKEFNSSLNELRRFCLRNVTVPASGPSLNKLQTISSEENLGRALRDGFELELNKECQKCIGSGGACGHNQSSSGFICYCADESQNGTCSSRGKANELHGRCRQPFTCGNQNDLFYPFWNPDRENCGHPDFKVECTTGFAEFNISSVKFRILEANSTSRVFRLARSDYMSNLCPLNPPNALVNENILPFAADTELLPIYNRCQDISLPNYAGGYDCGDVDRKNYYVTRNLSSPLPPEIDRLLNEFRRLCESDVSIPVSGPSLNTLKNNLDKDNLQKALEEGFKVGLNQECLMCMDSGGACGYDQAQTASGFVCYCIDEPRNHNCGYPNKGLSTGAKQGIGTASALMGVILIVAGLFCVIRCQKMSSDDRRQQNLIPLKHYSYQQVKRITKSFAEVVGKGGFGTVYRGTLGDGTSVAVKILKDSKGNGEDFINEVASMSKTSHVNIVSLLGFCSEGSKRAIIYEYLENGSLDQFISSNTSMKLDWMPLYGIALGVARGLEYLHHGCKTRIVHFDIKPQNILLDDNLCPKVSDFGLAKLCEKKESILSLLDTRGTVGYIAPEVFLRMYGRVSHKSDVYSYGMLLLEMIGARNKETFDQNTASNTSSMYFPEWIYKDLRKGDIGRLFENGISSEEEEVAKKMTLVGLWCIQPFPSDRPAMNRVVEMMEGNVEAIEVPPTPVSQDLPMPLQESSTFSEDISVYTEE